MIKEIGIMTAAAALSIGGLMGVSMADSTNDAPVTPATEIHGTPGNTPGFGGNSANPAGVGQGGNGIHMIANGSPGWNGTSAADGAEPPACVMHGGLGDNDGNKDNRNCD